LRPLTRVTARALLRSALAGGVALWAFAGWVTGSTERLEGQEPNREFRRLAEQLADQRLAEAEGTQALQEKALGILDAMVLEAVNSSTPPNLEGLNQHLAALVTRQPPVGEGYRVLRLGGSRAVYALVANFGLGGPSAVRLYAARGRYALAGRIDRFAQKDFFDEYLELVPLPAPVVLFITVAGRTDDLETGVFTAWQLDGQRLKAVWSSDLLQQSSYETGPDGFQLTYCVRTDEDNPRACREMSRDRYVWEGSAWKRVEQTVVPVAKR
jgi:uncharacterized coiled-coil protein SlyX